jgi:hypothetical protein
LPNSDAIIVEDRVSKWRHTVHEVILLWLEWRVPISVGTI